MFEGYGVARWVGGDYLLILATVKRYTTCRFENILNVDFVLELTCCFFVVS